MSGGIRGKHQKRRLYEVQGGLCHWCGQPMLPPELSPKRRGEKQQSNLCTLDHIDSRLNTERGRHAGKPRRVAACFECNQRRCNKEVAQLSIKDKWARSGRPKAAANA